MEKLIAMQKNLFMGHKGEIILTTQKDVDENNPMIAKDIIDAEHAQRFIKRWNEYDSLKAKADVCDELVEALKKYAGHLPACECMWKTLQSRKCTCGFEQALAKAKV